MTAKDGSGERSSTASCAGPRCRRPSPPHCCWRSPRRPCNCSLAPQGTESFPQSLEVIKVYHRMQAAFPGSALPANVVVKAPSVRTPAMQKAIGQLEQRAVASGRAFEPITVDVNKQGTVANITLPIAGNGTDAASNAAVPPVARDDRPRDRRRRPEHRGRRHRVDGRVERHRRQAEVGLAARRRVRPSLRVHA